MRSRVLNLSGFVIGFSLFLIIGFYGCSSSNESAPIDCDLSDLVIEATGQNPTDCTMNDGSITATASGGRGPYTFAINTGSFGTTSAFNNLGGGNYLILVKDRNGCERSVEVLLQLPGINPLSAEAEIVVDTECLTNNGSIDMLVAGGTPPYQYKLGAGAFSSTSIFQNLAPGNYSVTVKDDADCIFVKGITVGRGDSQTSLANDVKPIIETKCAIASCHSGSQSPNFTSTNNIISNASRIKSLIQSGTMPPSNSSAGALTTAQKALITCWVDDGAKDN
ncbi:MAG TPA: SprB repeat-containing protein [Cyclobacteriaceae bacterium]|nr:SprB repeat-containing protein [Cyclobacteriaceae bacterium]